MTRRIPLALGLASMLPRTAHAQFNVGAAKGIGLPGGELTALLASIVRTGLTLVGVAALGFFVYGGFLYITSGGDEDQIKRGKRAMIYAVIGIVAIGLAYAIVAFVVGAFESGGGGAKQGIG